MRCVSYDLLDEQFRASLIIRWEWLIRSTRLIRKHHELETGSKAILSGVWFSIRIGGYYGKNNLMCSDETTSGSTFFSNVRASSGLLIQALNLLSRTAILSYHHALLRIRFLWRLVFFFLLLLSARLTQSFSLPFAQATFSLRILLFPLESHTRNRGWWGRWQKKAHRSFICVVPGSIPRCLAETP